MVTAEPPKPAVNAPEREVWEIAPQAFPLRLQLPSEWELTDERLLELGSLNEEWHFETDCDGGLWIVAPPGTESSGHELSIGSDILLWSRAGGGGQAIGSGLVGLPNGWTRAPDAAWISDERIADALPAESSIWRVCPDFVVEVRSASDRPGPLRAKMEMWISQGARLAWLVDPQEESVWVYRPDEGAERVERPESLTAVEIADDLTVDFSPIWPRRDPDSETS